MCLDNYNFGCILVFKKMEIYNSLKDNIPLGWESTFSESLKGIKQVCKDIEADGISYHPNADLVFDCFRLLTPKQVKVVIVGQDPYHIPGLAHGLSFSCLDGIPPSLRNIYKELHSSIEGFDIPTHGNLTKWCSQGVLLLNTSLTAKSGSSGYKPKQWMDIIDSTVKTLTSLDRKIIWVMWGNKAQFLSKIIGERGIKLTAAHPSPLVRSGFDGCNHFAIINKTLTDLGKEPIDWSL